MGFLGHVPGKEGLRVDPHKLAVVAEWPVLRDVSPLISFPGMAKYSTTFVHHYAQCTFVLFRIVGKDRPWD